MTDAKTDAMTVAMTDAGPARYYWNPSTLVIPLPGGQRRLFQVHARRNVLATAPIMEFVDALMAGGDRASLEACHARLGSTLAVADASAFSLWDNAYRNSDFLDRTIKADDFETLDFETLMELLEDTQIVSRVWPPVLEYTKRSFADRFKGSFYEQIGTEALFNRTQPTEWWTRQKFEDDLRDTKPTPYKFIEERFLRGYVREHLSGADVLEIGSGTGYFTRIIAEVAERAVGMDYNAEYVEHARTLWPAAAHPNLEFHVGDIIDLSRGTGVFQDLTFDAIVLIDTFLFLFEPTDDSPLVANRDAIMANISRLLRPDGRLLIMDPHPLWLSPWLGLDSMPFGILTEYRNRHLKVIPTLEEMSGFLFDSGLRIRRMLEPEIDPAFEAIDAQAYNFMRNVPQWLFVEAEKA